MSKETLFIILILLLSSCGIVTKTRYGNGLKWNLEVFSNPKNEKSFEENHAKVAEKKNHFIEEKTTFINRKINFVDSPEIKVKPEIITVETEKDSIQNKNIPEEIKTQEIEYEKNAILAAELYFGGSLILTFAFLALISTAFGGIVLEIEIAIVTAILILSFIAIIVGYILAIISFTNINNSEKPLKGKLLTAIIIIMPLFPYSLIFLPFLLKKTKSKS